MNGGLERWLSALEHQLLSQCMWIGFAAPNDDSELYDQFQGSAAFFWPLRALYTHGTYT